VAAKVRVFDTPVRADAGSGYVAVTRSPRSPGGTMPTRTTARSASSAGRFGRQATTPNRFGRHATTPSRFGRQASTPSRFGRQATTPSRFGRPGTPSPRFATGRRRQPAKKSLTQQVMSALPGLVKGTSKPRRRGGGGRKRAGGMALLAGGLGLAMKNRDKLGGMMGRHSSDTGQMPPAMQTPSPDQNQPAGQAPPAV
jgi:hypothetical protein